MKRDDDWQDVVEAMGGTVCRLHHPSQHPGSDSDDEDEKDEEQMLQQRLGAFDPSCTWSVDWKVRRYVKPLKDANIPIFTAKEVAKAVANSQVLPGLSPAATMVAKTSTRLETQPSKTRQVSNGRLSACASANNSPVVSAEKNPSITGNEESREFVPSPQVATKRDSVEKKLRGSEDESEPQRSRPDLTRSKPCLQDSDDEEPETISQTTRTKVSAKDSDSDLGFDRRGQRGSRSTQQFAKVEDKKKESVSSRRQQDFEPMEVEEKDQSVAEESKFSKASKKYNSTDDKVAPETNQRQSSTDDGDKEIDRPAKRVKLGNSTNDGGWLHAAPSDPKKRMTHVRTKEEIMEAYGGDSHDLNTKPAITEWAPKPRTKVSSVVPAQSRRRRYYTGPNFKAFRKNHVPALHIVDYKWKSQRSGPAVQHAHLEEEQRAAGKGLNGTGLGMVSERLQYVTHHFLLSFRRTIPSCERVVQRRCHFKLHPST